MGTLLVSVLLMLGASDAWFYADSGGDHGPMSLAELEGAAKARKVRPSTIVWTTEETRRREARHVPELAAVFAKEEEPPPLPGQGPPPLPKDERDDKPPPLPNTGGTPPPLPKAKEAPPTVPSGPEVSPPPLPAPKPPASSPPPLPTPPASAPAPAASPAPSSGPPAAAPVPLVPSTTAAPTPAAEPPAALEPERQGEPTVVDETGATPERDWTLPIALSAAGGGAVLLGAGIDFLSPTSANHAVDPVDFVGPSLGLAGVGLVVAGIAVGLAGGP